MRFAETRGHDRQNDEPKPDLLKLLEHYGVQVRFGRTRQVVRCPIHGDRTPSLSVNAEAGLWKCHACGEGGDALTLIEKMEGVDFAGARAVAATLGITEGGGGGSDDGVSGSRYGGRRKVPARSRDRQGHSGFVPSWRRG